MIRRWASRAIFLTVGGMIWRKINERQGQQRKGPLRGAARFGR